jgi:hypothetical protein
MATNPLTESPNVPVPAPVTVDRRLGAQLRRTPIQLVGLGPLAPAPTGAARGPWLRPDLEGRALLASGRTLLELPARVYLCGRRERAPLTLSEAGRYHRPLTPIPRHTWEAAVAAVRTGDRLSLEWYRDVPGITLADAGLARDEVYLVIERGRRSLRYLLDLSLTRPDDPERLLPER